MTAVMKSHTGQPRCLASLWLYAFEQKKAVRFGDVQSYNVPTATLSPDGRWVAYSTNADDVRCGHAVIGCHSVWLTFDESAINDACGDRRLFQGSP